MTVLKLFYLLETLETLSPSPHVTGLFYRSPSAQSVLVMQTFEDYELLRIPCAAETFLSNE